jgi:hypothetical protein
MPGGVTVVLLLLAACASPHPPTRQPAAIPFDSQESLPAPGPGVPDPTLASVLVDGIELHYVERGSSTPVVLVHGRLADYTYWEWSDQIPLLAEGHHVMRDSPVNRVFGDCRSLPGEGRFPTRQTRPAASPAGPVSEFRTP